MSQVKCLQGGSSFNALVRAMKQQVVDTNTGERDPNLLFEINNLSMNKVQVFPDGELDIQARTSVPNSAAFVRPTSTGRALRAQRPGSLSHATPPRGIGAVLAACCIGVLSSCGTMWYLQRCEVGTEQDVKRTAGN
jgi:hypothetical protein